LSVSTAFAAESMISCIPLFRYQRSAVKGALLIPEKLGIIVGDGDSDSVLERVFLAPFEVDSITTPLSNGDIF
jgi:hypothetical protein